jgi:hypothetical protein
MATLHRWTNGTADENWGTVGNWHSGEVPNGQTDVAVMDGRLTQVGPTAGLDRTGERLKRLVIRSDFTGDIGGPGNYLKHWINSGVEENGRLIHRGSGDVYFMALAMKVDMDFVMDGRGSLHLDSEAGSPPGFIRHVFCQAGTVSLASTAFIGATVGAGSFFITTGPAAHIEIAAADTTQSSPTFLILWGGTVANARVVDADKLLLGFKGTLTQTGAIEDGAIVVFGEAANCNYETLTTLGASHNPDVAINGGLNVTKIVQEITLASFIRGPHANISGNVVAGATAASADVDLREEYP